jgi:hypothetical protein
LAKLIPLNLRFRQCGLRRVDPLLTWLVNGLQIRTIGGVQSNRDEKVSGINILAAILTRDSHDRLTFVA